LIDFFGEILKIVKLPVIRFFVKSRGLRFLPGCPEEHVAFVGEAIADSDSQCTAFPRTGNRRFPKTVRKRHSLRSRILFNSDEFDPSELL
jgi:hypothetical protein